MRLLLGVLLVTACAHSEPFDVPDTQIDGLLAGGEPARLTFADGVGEPSWLLDGTAIAYAGNGLLGHPQDRCLELVPAGGGTVRREVCDASAFAELVDTYAYPDASADRLAFLYQNAVAGGNPTLAGIFVAPLDAPVVGSAVRSLPFLGPDGVFYVTASHVRWLDADELIFIGHAEQSVQPCPAPACSPINVVYPRTLFRGGASAGAAFTPVPDLAFPSSVSPGAATDEIYFTLANDPRIYRRVLSTGEQAVIHDFGALGVARDVHFSAGRLTAIVGGKVQVWVEPNGPLQSSDSGGHLYVLDPATGGVRRLSDEGRWFRHPALSPAGSALVGEGYDVVIDQDTTVSPRGDLWLYGAP
jgi:hypothetical protein